MSDFYVTLPSNAGGSEFSKNTPSSFKVRLPEILKFEGNHWKVGLSSISLPDSMINVVDKLVPKENYLVGIMFMKRRPTDTTDWFNVLLKMDDIDDLRSLVDDEHFMQAIMNTVSRKIVEHLNPGDKLTAANGKLLYVNTRWIRRGSNMELLLDSTNTYINGLYETPRFTFEMELAEKMEWVKKKTDGTYELGPNLIPEPIKNEMSGDRKVIDSFQDIESQPALWCDEEGASIALSCRCNWRFVNLNNAYCNIVGTPNRTLHIYSDVGGSSINCR